MFLLGSGWEGVEVPRWIKGAVWVPILDEFGSYVDYQTMGPSFLVGLVRDRGQES